RPKLKRQTKVRRTFTRSRRDSLHDLELVPARIADIETSRAGYRARIRNNLDPRVTKSFFCFSEIGNDITNVARTQRTACFVLYRQVQLRSADLIPGAGLTRGGRFW